MKAVVTVLGMDRTGIIAKVSAALYRLNANILDINQTVMRDDIFTMVMLVDLTDMKASFQELADAMNECAKELGMDIRVQREEIFHSMHRI